MQCTLTSDLINSAQQSFIDTMNLPKNRKIVMNNVIQRYRSTWLGSWYLTKDKKLAKDYTDYVLKEDISNIFKRFVRSRKRNPFLFTFAYSSGPGYAHYVSFIYDPRTKTLFWFDPGRGLYQQGKMIQNAVSSSMSEAGVKINNVVDKTICSKDGCMQCTGDSFCQTWTLYFIFKYLDSNRRFDFLDNWANMIALERLDTIRCFVLDILNTFEAIDEQANYELQNIYGYPQCEVYDVLSRSYNCKLKE